jgi:hypothetical protein
MNTMKPIVLILFAVGTIALVHGEEPDWRAQWIWMARNEASDMMLARKTFVLSHVPERAQLSITASSSYELLINGRYIRRGPARCAPHHQSFDVLDVSDVLRKGPNVLAIRVHRRREGDSYQIDGPSGRIQTDSSWRVSPGKSWHNESPAMARFHLEVCDRVDLRRRVKEWTASNFDDSGWASASVLKREDGWPLPQKNDRPAHLIPPWTTLVERDITYLKEIVVPVAEPVHGGSIRAPYAGDDWVHMPVIHKIPVSGDSSEEGTIGANLPGECQVLVYDLGEVKNGRPYLDIEAPSGTVVDVMAAPYLLDGHLLSPIVDSSYVDRIVLSGERERWEAFYLKPTRWLAVVFRRLTGEATLYGAGLVQSKYPFEQKGHFQSSESPDLEALWEAAAKTVDVCTTDAYTDNYRERRQYAQTAYYACLGNYPIFGDIALQRRYLIQIAQEQLANGIMPAYAPRHGDDFMVILDSNCFWIRGLHQYLLYSGDAQTTRDLLPAARKLLGLLHRFTDSDGMINSPPYPYWLDHAVNDRREANLCMNGHYLGALEDFAQLLGWLNESDAHVFQVRSDHVRQSLRKFFWDPERKLFADAFVDGARSTLFSEHANAMALAVDVATPEQAEAIAQQLIARDERDFIHRESGITMVTPAMSYYLHAGLCKNGYVADSFRMLQERFKRMLRSDANGTLWEEWWLDGTGRTGVLAKGRTRSDAQTESAFPPALFTEFLLGIRPTQPGLKEVTLFRSDSGLRNIEGAIPSPEGRLTVRWRFYEDRGGELEVNIPGGMCVKLDIESLDVAPGERVLVNGRGFDPTEEDTAYLSLDRGTHHVQF